MTLHVLLLLMPIATSVDRRGSRCSLACWNVHDDDVRHCAGCPAPHAVLAAWPGTCRPDSVIGGIRCALLALPLKRPDVGREIIQTAHPGAPFAGSSGSSIASTSCGGFP